MSDEIDIGPEPAPGRYFPKTINPRQGTRKKDRWGPCKECGFPGSVRCHSCHAWRCREHIALRRAPGRIGVYFTRCLPGCRRRMNPEVVAVLRRSSR